MSIQYIDNDHISSSTNYMDVCDDGTYLYMLEDDSIIRKYSYDSGGLTYVGRTTILLESGLSTIALVNSASAICINTGTGTSSNQLTLLELSSMYVTNNETGPTTYLVNGQRTVSYVDQSIVLCLSASLSATPPFDNTLGCASYSQYTYGTPLSLYYVEGFEGSISTSIVKKDNSSAIIGTSNGGIGEVDLNGNTIKIFQLPQQTWITGLSYSNGFVLAAAANGITYSIKWNDSPVLVDTVPCEIGISGGQFYASSNVGLLPPYNNYINDDSLFGYSGTTLCQASSGLTVSIGSYLNTYTYCKQIRCLRVDNGIIRLDGVSRGNSGGVATSGRCGINNGYFWSVTGYNAFSSTPPFGYLSLYSLSAENTTDKTHAIVDNGRYVDGKKIIIVDDGVGESYIDSVVPIPDSPITYPVPAGKRIIDISLYNDGINRKGSVSVYNT